MKNSKFSTKKKILSSASMLVVSSIMFSTATYAWFTMNKEVKVTGMEVKAHSEEGLLINEVKLATSNTWDEEAVSGDSDFTSLRPASTYNLSAWWHANSKKSANEAGYGSGTVDEANTVAISNGVYYTDISSINDLTTNVGGAAGSAAEKSIYFMDATFGNTSGTCEDGEGFYVKYTYYLKSSSSEDLNVAVGDLLAKVTATNNDASASGASTDLDKSLRVGVMIDGNFMIFAPVSGADASYSVTNNTAGSSYTAVSRYSQSTDYVAINTAAITIPNVNTDGLAVEVYIWFEGEDTNCKSDNLTATLDSYTIDINFKDQGLGA